MCPKSNDLYLYKKSEHPGERACMMEAETGMIQLPAKEPQELSQSSEFGDRHKADSPPESLEQINTDTTLLLGGWPPE